MDERDEWEDCERSDVCFPTGYIILDTLCHPADFPTWRLTERFHYWNFDNTQCRLPCITTPFIIKSSKPFVLCWPGFPTAGTLGFDAGTHLFPGFGLTSWTYDRFMNPGNDFHIYEAWQHGDDDAYLRLTRLVQKYGYSYMIRTVVRAEQHSAEVFISVDDKGGWLLDECNALRTPVFEFQSGRVPVPGMTCMTLSSSFLPRLPKCEYLSNFVIRYAPKSAFTTRLHVKDEHVQQVVDLLVNELLLDDLGLELYFDALTKPVRRTKAFYEGLQAWLQPRYNLETLDTLSNGNMCFAFAMSPIRATWMTAVARSLQLVFLRKNVRILCERVWIIFSLKLQKITMLHAEDFKDLCVQEIKEDKDWGFPLAVSPCGNLVAVTRPDNQVHLIHMFTGMLVRVMHLPPWMESITTKHKVAFMKDVDQSSKYLLVSGFCHCSAVYILDTMSGDHVGYVTSPCGATLFSVGVTDLATETGLVGMCGWNWYAGRNTAFVRLYRGKGTTWSLLRTISTTSACFSLLTFSNETEVAVFDEERGAISCFDIKTGGLAHTLNAGVTFASVLHEVPRQVQSVHACANGTFLFAGVGGRKELMLIDNDGDIVLRGIGGLGYCSTVAIVPGLGFVARCFKRLIVAGSEDAFRKAAMSPLRVYWIRLVVSLSQQHSP